MKKLSIAIALLASLLCSPVQAKTFVGVLWPMFGPLPAIGLVELVAELKMMPDVEVSTYLHQSWPSLVEDLAHQPPGTRTIVIGYSLGANSTAFVANKTKYIDEIIALQPSMLSWNPAITGKVGHIIEVYNPNPWLTFGGMGSKKLVGDNIEYIANSDSHPGAQFSPEFRNLVKTEVTKISTESDVELARAETPQAPEPAKQPDLVTAALATHRPGDAPPPPDVLSYADAQVETPKSSKASKLGVVKTEVAKTEPAKAELPKAEPVKPAPAKPALALAAPAPAKQPKETMAFLDALSSSVDSGNLPLERQLTAEDLRDHAQRTYPALATADNSGGKSF